MQERYTNSLEMKTGENISSEKLISHSGLCSTRTVITVAVVQYHFQENTEPKKKHETSHSLKFQASSQVLVAPFF